ncbi:tRNA (adenosine(37)-N6)-threonylcarbamoyltransferase complex ATPase subunit type 1 TsaE [Aureliella helgolandensis]|uniref:tRNA threonylcarbamoyladenosine biosynthesis protein TsaE n=1 Tax=Aureliella helgolandensis TaxID=2527968 RepID=A0A518G4R2_9BACT|nr:tRNA (adenosine(37)-N6)-threonylcarbamoyltransferase complex ATPase subunit type 1 TsaE [Aureliella helgolandensis]QDV23540.1 tRNA threonylcarbamoyladenosine biosynthesis protein TsaE [Aureliella helgolandensis]
MTGTNSLDLQLPTLQATRQLARLISEHCQPPFTLVLNGTLGVGKTQLIRFLAEALGVPAEDVTSPTYVLLQRYSATVPIYHFDFYRLEHAAQVWDLGIDELYEQPAITVIEWGDKFPECLPEVFLECTIEQDAKEQRVARLVAHGDALAPMLQHLKL